MSQQYNQFTAMMAVAKASFRAIFRSPSAVVFSLGFPLIFILVFGFIGGGGVSVSVGLKNIGDTSNYAISALLRNPIVKLVQADSTDLRRELEKGRIAAIISIDSVKSAGGYWQYHITPLTSDASRAEYPILRSFLAESIQRVEQYGQGAAFSPFVIDEKASIPGRQYTMIDFILPGMLGFSLLSAGIFGVAFLFFNLRQMLVLKRFFATPIDRKYIVLGEGLSRVSWPVSPNSFSRSCNWIGGSSASTSRTFNPPADFKRRKSFPPIRHFNRAFVTILFPSPRVAKS